MASRTGLDFGKRGEYPSGWMSTQDDDFARELQSHLEHEADAQIHDGADPGTARRRAHLALGNTTRARERFYEGRRVLWLDHAWQDVRGAFRGMRRYPISAAVAILSLAFGIGATTVTLTVRNVLFRKPPPAARPTRRLRILLSRTSRSRTRLRGGKPWTRLRRSSSRCR